MRHTITLITAILSLTLLLPGCNGKANDWVYIQTDVVGELSGMDGDCAAAIADRMDKAAWAALKTKAKGLVYDSPDLDGKVTASCDAVYLETKDTVSASFTVAVRKYHSSLDIHKFPNTTIKTYRYGNP